MVNSNWHEELQQNDGKSHSLLVVLFAFRESQSFYDRKARNVYSLANTNMYLVGGNSFAQEASKEQTKMPRFMWDGPRP